MQSSHNRRMPQVPSNLVALQRDYINKMLGSCSGMKALIFDDTTLQIISMVYMQSEGFKKDAYLVENIKFLGKEKMSSMVGIFVLSSTESTIKMVKALLQEPVFKEYHLFFTSKVDDHVVRLLAEADEYDRVKKFQEVFMEYLAVTPQMMSTGLQTTVPLLKSKDLWKERENLLLRRMSNSLTGFLLNLRQKPIIRFLAGSEACEGLAIRVKNQLDREYIAQPKHLQRGRSTLLILDRSEDPATPLVFDWSYLSMIHELFGLEGNRTTANRKEYNMYIEDDSFLKSNVYSNFGEVASNLKDFLQRVAEKKQKNLTIEKFEDMKKVINSMPELKKFSSNANKHVDITGDISKQINMRDLLSIGELEQTMLGKDTKSDSYREILERFEDAKTNIQDLIRLVMLYNIKHEGDSKASDLNQRLKNKLKSENTGNDMIKIVDTILAFGGKAKRQNTFLQSDLSSKLKGKFKQYFNNVPNVYCLYRPYLETLIDDLYNCNLSESAYICTEPQTGGDESLDSIFVYIIGGVTYIESRIIFELRQKYPDTNIFLGGSHTLNSKAYTIYI